MATVVAFSVLQQRLRTPDCDTIDNLALVIPMAWALPVACLVTSRWVYRLGSEALSPQSCRLGNIVFPLLGLIVGCATIVAAQSNADRVLEMSRDCEGG